MAQQNTAVANTVPFQAAPASGDRLSTLGPVPTVTVAGENVNAKAKAFSTGSIGFTIYGKVTINGKRYQVTGNLVQIGSKAE